ncbi:MAG: hypothetical protein AB8H03_24485 [Saprospiraceae bacterium]
MENADFDKFIKSNARKSLDVPEGLDWDNMNIPLPPKKKNRKFFFLLWFGLFFLIGGAFIYLNIATTTANEEIENITQLKNEKINSKIEFEASEKVEIPQPPSSSSIEIIDSKNITNTLPIISSSKTIIEEDSKIASDLIIKSLSLIDSTSEKTLEIESVLAIQTNKPFASLDQKSQINLVGIQSINSLIEIPIELKKELSLPTYFELPLKTLDDNKLSLSLSFGVNTFLSNYRSGSQIDLLKTADNQAIGTSYNLGLQYQLKKGFFTTIGVSYQNLHHTFSYREELDPILDFTQFQQINRTKKVFYNNYSQIVELNIGGGKSFFFGKNWGSQIALNINPALKIKSTGRTLNDDKSIIDIEDFAVDQKLFISAGAEVRLFYKIKNNHIFTSLGYKHALSNLKLLNNSTLTLQPQILNINLGISRNF